MSLNILGIFQSLIMILAANGAPIVVGALCGNRFSEQIDLGVLWPDDRRMFGRSKTWRGLVSAIGLTAALAYVLDIDPVLGAFFGLTAMAGDLMASFCKRRLGLPESSQARGFDTVPESLLPLVLFKTSLGLSWLDISVVVLVFFLIEEYISPILYRLHIRKRPY
jgi:CDP-diglyceride synthetase